MRSILENRLFADLDETSRAGSSRENEDDDQQRQEEEEARRMGRLVERARERQREDRRSSGLTVEDIEQRRAGLGNSISQEVQAI